MPIACSLLVCSDSKPLAVHANTHVTLGREATLAGVVEQATLLVVNRNRLRDRSKRAWLAVTKTDVQVSQLHVHGPIWRAAQLDLADRVICAFRKQLGTQKNAILTPSILLVASLSTLAASAELDVSSSVTRSSTTTPTLLPSTTPSLTSSIWSTCSSVSISIQVDPIRARLGAANPSSGAESCARD